MAGLIVDRLDGGRGESSHCTGTHQLDVAYSKVGVVAYVCIGLGIIGHSLCFESP